MAGTVGAASGAGGPPAAPAAARTRVTLVTGPRAAVREAAIAAALAHSAVAAAAAASPPAASAALPPVQSAVILEGLADANSPLISSAEKGLNVQRIAPGCLCCAGNLVLRVTLNRLLRRPPAQLFISLANAEHVDQLRSMLQQAPYGDLLDLDTDLQASA